MTPGVDKGEEQIKAEHRPGANVIKKYFFITDGQMDRWTDGQIIAATVYVSGKTLQIAHVCE